MNTRFLVHTILASASLACFSASAADLKEVYERALTNDPLIREAEANRLATRESKPQALAALLPQVSADGVWNDTVDTNSTGIFVAPGVPLTPQVNNFDGDSSSWNLTLRQSVFRWENWATLPAREFRARPGGSRLCRRAAGPRPAHGRGLFQRARGARHARGRAGRVRRHRPPARAVREALRGRPDRGDRRAGREGRLRFRERRADPGQAQPSRTRASSCAN